MTVSTTANRVVNLGNGVTTVWNYSFPMPSAADAVVIYTDTNGVQNTLTATQYTITGINNPTGGSVTYPIVGAPIATGTSLTIERVLPIDQPISLSNQGPPFAATEDGLDNLTYICQQIQDEVGRSLMGPPSDPSNVNYTLPTVEQRANQFLTFDSNGNVAAGSAVTGGVFVSAAMQPVVGAGTLPTARQLFNASMSGPVIDDGSGNLTITSGSVTTAMLHQAPALTLLGNASTNSTASVAYLVSTQIASFFTKPTIQTFTSGSGTYVTPSNCIYIQVEMVGGGAGSAGSGTTAGAGGAGGNTTFGTTFLTATGGSGGSAAGDGTPSAGGTGSGGDINFNGGNGGGTSEEINSAGGNGGISYFGGAAVTAVNSTIVGVSPAANTGSGAAGAGCSSTAPSGGGGGAGGYLRKLISSPSTTYSYAVGSIGTAGHFGTGGATGSTGSSGIIIVTEYYLP